MPVPETARVAAAVDCLTPDLGQAALPVVYRLLYAELARQAGVELSLEGVVAALWPHRDPDLVSGAQALLRTDASSPTDDVRALAELHEALLHPGDRRAAGAYFTPWPLVHLLLDQALEPALDEAALLGEVAVGEVTVCDPTCGSGLFLVEAARRIVRRGVPVDHVLGHCVHGVDRDPAAVELARVSLWLACCRFDDPSRLPDVKLSVADALLDTEWVQPFDVVAGNPPFLNRLERRTALAGGDARRLAEQSGGVVRPYTDVSAIFLHRAVDWVRPGGRVALVQPQSLLAARDASGVRAELSRRCSLESLWASDRPVFDAGVLACAVVLRRDGEQGRVMRWQGAGAEPVGDVAPGDLTGSWSHLVAEALGVPPVVLAASGTVADVADCTADFRDQYYGLAPYVHESADCSSGAPLLTTGLIDPAVNLWGTRPTRFLKQRWASPVIDVTALAHDPALSRWVRARLVPKVVVGTQGRVVEAVADEGGRMLPSVPVITVVPRETSLWHLLAVLLAPPVSAHAAATYAGSGLSMHAVKLSARQVAGLPLPGDRDAWDEGARLASLAQGEPGQRLQHLAGLGRAMCIAYGVPPDAVLPWWLERLR